MDCLTWEVTMPESSSQEAERLLSAARSNLLQVQTDEGAERLRNAQIAVSWNVLISPKALLYRWWMDVIPVTLRGNWIVMAIPMQVVRGGIQRDA